MNNCVFSGKVVWASYEETAQGPSLSVMINVTAPGKKNEAGYSPSFAAKAYINGAYAKAMSFIAEEYQETKMTAIISGKMAVPSMREKEGEMIVNPITLMYGEIDVVKTTDASAAKPEAEKKEPPAPTAIIEDMFA